MCLVRTIHDKNNPYTIINNNIFKNSNLSWRSKGIYAYAFSRPDDWSFNITDLVNQCKENKHIIYQCLKKLETEGYLERVQKKDNKGRFQKVEYTFYETPHSNSPHTVNQPLQSKERKTKYGNKDNVKRDCGNVDKKKDKT